MAKEVAPNFDQAYTALLEDLEDRGLLSNTMVVALGEFGRTPKINPAGGRDHHPGVWTILMGGGPIKGGRVIGESDELGYAPKTRPVTPGEVAATLYQRPRPRPAPANCPARRTGRCRWSISPSSRSTSCSELLPVPSIPTCTFGSSLHSWQALSALPATAARTAASIRRKPRSPGRTGRCNSSSVEEENGRVVKDHTATAKFATSAPDLVKIGAAGMLQRPVGMASQLSPPLWAAARPPRRSRSKDRGRLELPQPHHPGR